MSYDLCVLAPGARGSLQDLVARLRVEDDEGGEAPGPDRRELTTMRSLAAALVDVDGALAPDGDEEPVGDQAAPILFHREWGYAVEVARADQLNVSLRYGLAPSHSQLAWGAIARLLAALERLGFRAFDPQLDRILDLAADLPEVIAGYDAATAAAGGGDAGPDGEAPAPPTAAELAALRDELQALVDEQAAIEERVATLVVIRSSLMSDADEGPDGSPARARAMEVEQELDALRARLTELRAQILDLRLRLTTGG